ncbi:flagellar hook-length control protein FliK [Rhodobacteraceae bacterium KMM 6894]|nr:flagellar hook-length control protein FliK [Rhodobacteraceae bacterium KMM 6894]
MLGPLTVHAPGKSTAGGPVTDVNPRVGSGQSRGEDAVRSRGGARDYLSFQAVFSGDSMSTSERFDADEAGLRSSGETGHDALREGQAEGEAEGAEIEDETNHYSNAPNTEPQEEAGDLSVSEVGFEHSGSGGSVPNVMQQLGPDALKYRANATYPNPTAVATADDAATRVLVSSAQATQWMKPAPNAFLGAMISPALSPTPGDADAQSPFIGAQNYTAMKGNEGAALPLLSEVGILDRQSVHGKADVGLSTDRWQAAAKFTANSSVKAESAAVPAPIGADTPQQTMSMAVQKSTSDLTSLPGLNLGDAKTGMKEGHTLLDSAVSVAKPEGRPDSSQVVGERSTSISAQRVVATSQAGAEIGVQLENKAMRNSALGSVASSPPEPAALAEPESGSLNKPAAAGLPQGTQVKAENGLRPAPAGTSQYSGALVRADVADRIGDRLDRDPTPTASPTRTPASGVGAPPFSVQSLAAQGQVLQLSNAQATMVPGDGGPGDDPTAGFDPILSGEVRLTPGGSEVRNTSALGAAQRQTPETARQIAVQISEAVARGADRPIDLTLNPAELGRVRISLSAGDGAMMINVLAERPETLDLMRRNIDMLTQEMRDIGYDGTGFSFSQGSDNHPSANADGDGRRDAVDGRSDRGVTATGMPVARMTAAPSGPEDRLDIRL